MRTLPATSSVLAVLALALGACSSAPAQASGQSASEDAASSTVDVIMDDSLVYSPATVQFEVGETITFRVENRGKIRHEFVLGTADEQATHGDEMAAMGDGDMSDDNVVSLDGGEEGQITWQFTAPGEYAFACHEPGHFEAGMVGAITVVG